MENAMINEQGTLNTGAQNINLTERIVSAAIAGGLVAYGLKRKDAFGAVLAFGGILMGYRGATGHCQFYEIAGISTVDTRNPNSPYGHAWLSGKVHVTKSVTINKPAAELYRFWRNFENLPVFMSHLESVSAGDETHSHWKASAPFAYSVEWDAEVTSDIENERIGWRSIQGSDIANSGVVEFHSTADRGTEVKVHLTYEAPGGRLGALAAKLFGEEPGQQVAEDLRRFKALMEAGSIMKVEGQPSGRAAQAGIVPANR
jgi:uncharacterized membrane protein